MAFAIDLGLSMGAVLSPTLSMELYDIKRIEKRPVPPRAAKGKTGVLPSSQLRHHVRAPGVELVLLSGADDSAILRPLHHTLQQAHVLPDVRELFL